MFLKEFFAFFMIFIPVFAFSDFYVWNKGESAFEVSYLYYDTDEIWDRRGSKVSSYGTFRKNQVKAFVEYGFTDRDVISLKFAYDSDDETMDGRNRGFSDAKVGWRHFWTCFDEQTFFTRLVAIVPFQSGYEPGIRYGCYGVEGDIGYANFFMIRNHYTILEMEAGFRLYEGFASNQLRARLNVMSYLTDRVYLSLKSYLYYGLFDGKERLDQSLFWLNPNYRLWKGQVEVGVNLYKGAFISAGYFYNLWGQSVGAGGGFIGRMIFIF